MAVVRQLWRSAIGLLSVIVRHFGSAARCALTRRSDEAAEHVRFAFQALHDDLAALAAMRHQGVLPSQRDVDRILIVKLDRVGDMVNTTPVFDALRERYPKAQLDLVGHPAVLPLLDGDPRIQERFQYRSALYHGGRLRPPGLSAWRLMRRLWHVRYPLVVYLRGSFPFLPLAARSRFVAAKFVSGEPLIRRYLKPLGLSDDAGDPLPEPILYVARASRDRVLAKYPNWAAGPSVVIHAMSTAVGKQWPLERFAWVADQIVAQGQGRVLFLAAPAERDKIARLHALCRQAHDFETQFSLPEVVAAIAHARVFIGNDSGLAHIAAAVKTREVVVWGAANLEMARPAAKLDRCTLLYRDVACRAGCPEVRCVGPNYLKCLLDIAETEVLEAALNQLRSAWNREKSS